MRSRRYLSAGSLLVALAAGPATGPVPAQTRVATLLPTQDLYIDPGNPKQNYNGKALQISSSSEGQPEKLALVLFDLGVIPPGSKIEQAQLVLTVLSLGQGAQQVQVTYVDDNSWTTDLTYSQAGSKLTTVGTVSCGTHPTAPCLAGGWMMFEGNEPATVFTSRTNSALVGSVQAAIPALHSDPGGQLSLQLSSNTAKQQELVDMTYSSSASAADAETYSYAPRLLVSYTPPETLLARDWPQWQGDWRHTGRTPWKFAQSPVTAAVTGQCFPTTNQPNAPVIYGGQLYYYRKASGGNALYRMAPDGTVQPLTASTTLPTGSIATALGPWGYLYAASNTSLFILDLDDGGTQLGEKVTLNDFTGKLTVGPAGGVYLVDTLSSSDYRVTAFALRGGSSPSLVKSWEYELTNAPGGAITLSADGSLAYVATDSSFYAVCNATVSAPAATCSKTCNAIGRLFWNASFTTAATPQTPVAANDGRSTVYLARGGNLYAFQCTSSHLKNTPIQSSAFAQPVLTADNVLIAPQYNAFYAVVTNQGYVYQAAKNCLSQISDCVSPQQIRDSHLTTEAGTQTLLDGNDHLYYVDSSNKASAHAYETDTDSPSLTPKFTGVAVTAPQSSLILGPSGTVYYAASTGIEALEPNTDGEVTISGWADGTAYRASSNLTLSSDSMPPSSSIILQSDGSITYPSPASGSFGVPAGTQVFNLPGCCLKSPPSTCSSQ